jgi:hypothetical protein
LVDVLYTTAWIDAELTISSSVRVLSSTTTDAKECDEAVLNVSSKFEFENVAVSGATNCALI